MDFPQYPSNPARSSNTSSQGQSALLLVECLMHALVEKKLLSREDFIDIVEGAAEVESELAMAGATPPADAGGSFLSPMAAAFRKELGR
jgi:hypothetical protein